VLERDLLEVVVGDRRVDRAHLLGLVGAVGVAEEEDLAGALLPDHAREVGRAVAAVEARDVRVGLLEARVLLARERHVADDVQAVAAARGPAGHHGEDDLRHEADEALDLEDVQAPELGGIGVAPPSPWYW
jgi:hypothetical protein